MTTTLPHWFTRLLQLPKLRFRSIPRLEAELREQRKRREKVEQELRRETSTGRALSVLYRPLISADSTIQQMADSVLEQALQLTGSRIGFVAAIDGEGRSRVRSVTPIRPGFPQPGGFSIRRDENGAHRGLRGDCLNTGEPFFTNAPLQHPAFDGYPDWHPGIERVLTFDNRLVNTCSACQIITLNCE